MTKDPAPQSSVPMDELRRIVKLMKDNDLSEFQFEKEGFKVKLRRGVEPGNYPMSYTSVPPPSPAYSASALPATSQQSSPAMPSVPEGEEITSPMVGTFYNSPSPEAEPFVQVGDNIQAGDTLCIIEAMKVMNEIKAEKSGTITAIVASDSNPVQFGEVLFRMK